MVPFKFSEKGAPKTESVPVPCPLLAEAISAHDRGVLQAGFLLVAGIEEAVLVIL